LERSEKVYSLSASRAGIAQCSEDWGARRRGTLAGVDRPDGVGDRLTAIIIPLNAERLRDPRRAFGTALEEWPGQKLARSSA